MKNTKAKVGTLILDHIDGAIGVVRLKLLPVSDRKKEGIGVQRKCYILPESFRIPAANFSGTSPHQSNCGTERLHPLPPLIAPPPIQLVRVYCRYRFGHLGKLGHNPSSILHCPQHLRPFKPLNVLCHRHSLGFFALFNIQVNIIASHFL
jgi:hypothetical protein